MEIPILTTGRAMTFQGSAQGQLMMTVPALRVAVAIVVIIFHFANLAVAKEMQAERVVVWDFQRDNDANFDTTPDGWKRRLDRQHPAYIGIQIASRSPEKTQIALDAQGTLAAWLRRAVAGREATSPNLPHPLWLACSIGP